MPLIKEVAAKLEGINIKSFFFRIYHKVGTIYYPNWCLYKSFPFNTNDKFSDKVSSNINKTQGSIFCLETYILYSKIT